MSFRVAETHGRQTNPRPVRGVSRNVHVSERVARGRNVRDSERVECQSYKVESIGKRTRYYQSMIDTDSLLKGADEPDEAMFDEEDCGYGTVQADRNMNQSFK